MGVSPIQGGSHIRSFVFDLSELTLAWGEGIWGASHPVISGVVRLFFFFFLPLNLVSLVTSWKEEVEWKRRW